MLSLPRNLALAAMVFLSACTVTAQEASTRPRARDLGIVVGSLPTGRHNAITDVPGVRVGHVTLKQGDSIRTGLTAVLPHGGDLFSSKVTAAFVCFNGFGKPFGTVQIEELGEIETPILLGSTLSVPRIADGIIDYVLENDATGRIRSVNPVVGETNDGYLSDGRARPITSDHVKKAIGSASTGPVREGAVGAGTGTRCFGVKGGIGTSSRTLNVGTMTYTVGVLVQSNFGGELRISGRIISVAPGRQDSERGSCAIVIATDAPLTSRQLKRLARRTFVGMGRTGASFSHGSGDYAFAFASQQKANVLLDRQLTPFLQAAADSTEEAIYNSLLKAETVVGRDGNSARAIDIETVKRALGGS